MKKLTGLSTDCQRLKRLKIDEADRGRAFKYELGQIIEPHANMGNRKLPIGKRAKVIAVKEKTVWVENHKGERLTLDLNKADKFNVYQQKGVFLMHGDQIRITKTGKTLEGSKISNGSIEEVDHVESGGDIVLKSGQSLPADFMHFDYGYCVTSHSSQGRTVDDVFIAESSMSFPAASLEQFYVSCSRGRERLRIFTDDRDELKRAISRSCARKSAHDYDWDAQAKLRNPQIKGLQQVTQRTHAWLENFAEQIAVHSPDSPAASLTPTIPKDVPPTISPRINKQPSIEIDL